MQSSLRGHRRTTVEKVEAYYNYRCYAERRVDPYWSAARIRLAQLFMFSKNGHRGGNASSPCEQVSGRLETPKKEWPMYHKNLECN